MSSFRRVFGFFQPLLLTSAFVAGVCVLSTPAFSKEQKNNISNKSSQNSSHAQDISDTMEAIKDPQPVVKTCSEAGFGFFSVGNDTCLRIGGFVRAEAGYQQPRSRPFRRDDAFATYARGRIELDGRTATAYGPFRAFIRYELTGQTGFYRTENTTTNTNLASSLDKAFIQFMQFTVGRNQSFFDFYADALNFNTGIMYGLGSDYGTANLVAYTAKINKNFVATLSLEDRNQRNLARSNSTFYNTAYYRSVGQRFPDVIGALSFEDKWGTAQISGALHYVDHLPGDGTLAPRSKPGAAVQIGTRLNADKISAGDAFWVQGAYVNGALSYLGIGGDLSIGAAFVPMTDAVIQDQTMTLTTGYGAVAAYQHQWAPNVRQAVYGNYTVVNYNDSFAPLYGVATTRIGTVGSNIVWSPVKDFDVGVEVIYSKFSRGNSELPPENGPRSSNRTWAALRVQKAF